MASNPAPIQSDGPPQRTSPEWLIVVCSGERYAVPLLQVQEILVPQPFTRLPGCGPEVCGLIGLRGRIVTVFDIGAIMGRRPARQVASHRLLLLEVGGGSVAGAVDEVVAVEPTATARILDLAEVVGRLVA